MVAITFIEPGGARHEVDVPPGRSVMEAAKAAGIRGIIAECGGACACSTCHVYLPADWPARLPPMGPHEQDMLDFAWQPKPGQSRLGCQLILSAEMEGLILQVPERQA